MLIGVISDTHGLLRPEALAALHGSDHIIHAGDVGKPGILETLREIAPVTAVRGNVDLGAWAEALPETANLRFEDVAVHVLHNVQELAVGFRPGPTRVVIYGHSHKPEFRWDDRWLYFNPGSAGPRRFRLPITVGRLRISGAEVTPEIIHILE